MKMVLTIDWGSGSMTYSADFVMSNMSMKTYEKWVRLFAQYGTSQQHKDFLELLRIHIIFYGKGRKLKLYQRKYELLRGLVS